MSTHRSILRLAIPNIISNLSVPLLGAVDTAMMGHMDSAYFLGAIALGSVLFNIIYWGFAFLRMGTTGLTAQAYGSGNEKAGILIFGQSLVTGLLGAGVILLLQYPISGLGFMLIQGEQAVKDLAHSYFHIRIWAAPATLAMLSFHGWFLGMQNATYPMLLTILVNILNVGFNLLFVFQFDMKSDGVALGTVVSQYLGILFAGFLFMHKYKAHLHFLDIEKLKRVREMGRFFAVNSDIFIRTICLVFVFTFFTAVSSAIDPIVLAANSVLIQCFYLMSYGVDGFAFAGESLIGRYTGSGEYRKMVNALKGLFLWTLGLSLIFGTIFYFFGDAILYLFTDIDEVLQQTRLYKGWMIAVSLAGAFAFMWDGVYIGATASRAMRNTMLLATFGFFLPVYYIFIEIWGNAGLWLAMVLFMTARSISLALLARKEILKPVKQRADNLVN